MKKVLLSFSVVTSLIIPSFAFALPIGKNVLKYVKAPAQKTAKETPSKCADFSGTWTGTCSPESEIQNLVIKQHGCATIVVHDEGHTIGGLNTVQSANPPIGDAGIAVSYANTELLDWNSTRDVLSMKGSIAFRILGNSQGNMISYASQIKLVEGKLVAEWNINGETTSCTYEKQP